MNQKRKKEQQEQQQQQQQQQQNRSKKQRKKMLSNSSNVSKLIAYLQLCNNTSSLCRTTLNSSCNNISSGDQSEPVSFSSSPPPPPVNDNDHHGEGFDLSLEQPSASSLLIISRLLRTGNTMMDLLLLNGASSWRLNSCFSSITSPSSSSSFPYDNDDDDNDETINLISKKKHINARTLGLLLSAIYQNELCQESIETLLAKSCKIPYCSGLTNVTSCSPDRTTMMMQQSFSTTRASPCFILNFVLRILHHRYKDDDVIFCQPWQKTHQDDSMQQIMDCWKTNNGGHHVVSSCTRKRSSLSFVQVGEDCQDQEEEEEDDEEFWIPCIAFMMAFKIFKQRMESQSYIVISRPPKDCNNHGDIGPSSSCCFTFSKQDKSRDDIVMDPVMVGAVRLIHWSKLLASFVMKRFHTHHNDDDDDDDHKNDDDDDDGRDDLNNCRDNPLRQLFGKEFDWIDAFVEWMEEKPSLSRRTDNNSTDNGIMDHERNETVQPLSVQNYIITNQQEEINHLQQLWTYFDVRYHHGDNQQVSDDSNDSKSSNVAGDVDIKTKMTSIHHKVDNQVLSGDEKHSKDKTYVINAIDLRPDLLKMSKNAISQEITVMAEKIVTLLDDAGSKDGAMGIEMVATVLATGNAIMQQQQQGSSIDVEQLDLEIFPFSDSLLASITKRYVTEEMSSARICSFLGSFVLPSITALARKESRPASRQLVTMLMNLARDRPCEVMSALVIPTMHGVAYLTTSTHHCKKHQISKGQTELFTRLIKSKSFSTDDMSKLASELVHVEWTDQSISVFMTCLQRKPILSSATFSKLVERICMCCNEKILVASSNFSSFFHLIVNKYNSQVKQERCEDVLLRAANELTTYMKKAIISAITKLQNEG